MVVKILNRINIRFFLVFIFSTSVCLSVKSQQIKVISSPREYQHRLSDDSLLKMVELKGICSGIIYDLRYATPNNFTGRQLYKKGDKTYLRLKPAEALRKVQEELSGKGLGLKVFDAYRPYAATVKMWNLVKDERYVANPSKGSGHNRGLAIDLTIIHLNTKEELDMGTGFDNFTDSAHHDFKELPENVLENRMLLKGIMEKYGFTSLETEWWHYYWPNNRKYDVLNIGFQKLGEQQ